ncbi:MAG: hypothetical protein HRU20_16930 [Pseudomonadales bacterium]|nr:hypothetical protein [Pseudomonadales bacterium]
MTCINNEVFILLDNSINEGVETELLNHAVEDSGFIAFFILVQLCVANSRINVFYRLNQQRCNRGYPQNKLTQVILTALGPWCYV